MSDSTPRPWAVGFGATAVSSKGRTVALCREGDIEERLSNAALIVEAVNALSAHKACVEALRRYRSAIHALGERGPNRVTYFEGSVTRDDECQRRWQELNDAGKQANEALAALKALEKGNV